MPSAGIHSTDSSGKRTFRPRAKAPPSAFSRFTSSFSRLNPKALFTRKKRPPVARSIFVNTPLPTGPEWRNKKGKVVKDRVFPTNQNVTSKYTIITFLPRNLFEQFRRVANVFFLGIAILQFFPKFSTISPGLVILPLLAVLAITALKDGYEDIKRHQSDHKVNHTIAHVLGGGPGTEHHLVKKSGGDRKFDMEIQPVEGYHNYNSMGKKSKTFVPAIPLPSFRKRKEKKAAKLAAKQGSETSAMREGVVAAGDEDWQDSRPAGSTRARGERHDSPFADHRANALDDAGAGVTTTTANNAAKEERVTSADTDPEAFDDPAEVSWKQTIWEDVRVGDFIKIYENQALPADIVICATSDEEDVCYIETKNLDGETNLKSRHAVPELARFRDVKSCSEARFQVDVEAPDVNMFRLNGAVVMPGEGGAGPDGKPLVHPVNLETVVLRGCVLKNTAWIIGVIIFTGEDTKIILNSGGTPSKRSKVERQMNPQVLFNLALLAAIAVVCAIVDSSNEKRWDRQQAYWELYADTGGDNPRINGLVTLANSVITFQNIIPISLYISIEFVRTAQAAFIYWDHSIKYVKNGVTTRTTARSWNLSDDLGQIEYVFSDKTGTLTQNSMVFRQCSIGGKVYTGDGEIPEGTLLNDPKNNAEKMSEVPSSSDSSDTPLSPRKEKATYPPEPHASTEKPKVLLAKEVLAPFHDPELLADLNKTETEQSRLLHGFFAVLGLCHTALAAEVEPGVIEYKAQSPDEAALVQAAADVGFVFLGRDRDTLRLSTPFSDGPDEYELLQVLEFNSTRKRMSVLIRKLDDERRIFLLTKGADNVIFERLAPGNEEMKAKTDSDLQYFAGEGLRTLCLAYRIVSDSEYEEWSRRYHDASVALENREGRIEEVSASIERELVLLGSTAIEDRLQDGVPEAIADLKRAGIKVWVATGDKLETAVAIGYTTNLLTKDSNLIIIREGKHSIYDQLKNALEAFFDERVLDNSNNADQEESGGPSMDGAHKLKRLDTGVTSLVGKDNGTKSGGYSLVIDGAALRVAFEDELIEEVLLELSTQCNTVICCRVSPLQKAQIVHLVKDNLGVMTLAIGDGANDVSMIQAADIGVGISGEEGLQAVNSSDYAIAQFRFLKRLLFVHGHWSYVRNSNMILNFFYKNVINIGVLFWFQFYCGFSSTYVFEYTYLLFWNVFWTLLPVIALGLFDKDIEADPLMALPELYRYGREGRLFGLRRFLWYILQGAFQSAVIYFFVCYAWFTTSTKSNGIDVGQYSMSTVMVIATVMVASVFTLFNTHAWNHWVFWGSLVGPFLVWIYTLIYSIIPPSVFATYAYGNDSYLFPSAEFWFGWIFVFVTALLPWVLYHAWQQIFRPNDIEIMRQVSVLRRDVDIEHDPTLGGREKRLREAGERPDNQPVNHDAPEADAGPGFGRSADYEEAGESVAQLGGRQSLDRRRDVLGRIHSARGSQVDMSTGLRRAESRGFDFDIEEGGVAISRMQSRLSQISRQRKESLLKTPTKGEGRNRSSTLGSLRARAGSVLRPRKKGFFEQTSAMEGETGQEDRA